MSVKVYVVTTGCYDQYAVSGVYASAEAAMAAHPVPADYKYPAERSAANLSTPGGWHRCDGGGRSWSNGLDWNDHAEITEYDVVDVEGA